jgi:hypothetical protein
MAQTYLISPARLKEASELGSNVDDKIVKLAITTAQDIEIEQILGTDLMDKIKSLVPTAINDPGNAAYKTLLNDYLENALIFYTLEHLMPLISVKLLNKGAMKREAEEAQPLSNAEREDRKREHRRKAEFYADKMMRYLIVHQEEYPEYINPDLTIDKTAPRRKASYKTGFYLDDDNPPKRNNGNPQNW